MIDLGTLGGGDSNAYGVSGSYVVGWSYGADGAEHAFAYNLTAGVMTDLGIPSGDTGSWATGISGKVVVGASAGSDGNDHPFIYVLP
jgi:probable HAF family extracellular repeat protein